MSSQVLATNEVLGAKVFAADEASDVGGGDRSKHVEPKTRKSKAKNWLSPKNRLSQKAKNWKNC